MFFGGGGGGNGVGRGGAGVPSSRLSSTVNSLRDVSATPDSQTTGRVSSSPALPASRPVNTSAAAANTANTAAGADLTVNNTSVNSVVTDYDYGDWLDGAELTSRISPARRFFSLFVTFDALLCTILWLVCIVLSDKNLVTEVVRQIVHYSAATSLFDIVGAAFLRFLLLILVYVIIKMNHWVVVTLTVAASSVGCIVKIMYFTWHSSSTGSTFQATLLIAFFILGWLEVWLFDSKVIPQERRARAIIERRYNYCAPTAHPTLLAQAVANRRVRDYLSTCTTSVANFYSPMASPPESWAGDYEPDLNEDSVGLPPFASTPSFHHHQHLQPPPVSRGLAERRLRRRMQAEQACRWALDIVNATDWEEQEQLGEADFLYWRTAPVFGGSSTVRSQYMFTCTVPAVCSQLAAHLVTPTSVCDKCPQWNSAMHACRLLSAVDGQCEVRYQQTTALMRGTVAPRSFTVLRLCGQRGDMYFCASVSTCVVGEAGRGDEDDCCGDGGADQQQLPVAVPATMYPTILTIRPCVERARHSVVEWLINSDCKPGLVPRSLVDRGTCQAARVLHADLQKMAAKLAEQY